MNKSTAVSETEKLIIENSSVGVEITGATPILMHADNIDWADELDAWKNNPKNKGLSKPGDDRTPPWRWIGCLYTDGHYICIPTQNVMRAIMGGAAEVLTGRGKKTFKAQSQAGLVPQEAFWPLMVNGKRISLADVMALKNGDLTFVQQKESVGKLGFALDVRRVRIGNAKHIRVRPVFDSWSVAGNILIRDREIAIDKLETILDIAGRTRGLGDWRTGAPTPGSYGLFTAKVCKI